MAGVKVPISIRISYGLLREWLKLPADVDLLGIPGINDMDETFTVIAETPVHHIKGANLTVQYRKDGDEIKFNGFA
jgi:hypothetical protein